MFLDVKYSEIPFIIQRLQLALENQQARAAGEGWSIEKLHGSHISLNVAPNHVRLRPQDTDSMSASDWVAYWEGVIKNNNPDPASQEVDMQRIRELYATP